MNHEHAPIDEQAHEARVELKDDLTKFLASLADEYPSLAFDQDEEYVIIRQREGDRTEAHILRSKHVPQKDASSIAIKDYIRMRCEELSS